MLLKHQRKKLNSLVFVQVVVSILLITFNFLFGVWFVGTMLTDVDTILRESISIIVALLISMADAGLVSYLNHKTNTMEEEIKVKEAQIMLGLAAAAYMIANKLENAEKAKRDDV